MHVKLLADPARLRIAAAVGKGSGLKVLALGHIKRTAKPIGDVFGLANMIGVHVGANDTDHGLAAQRISKNVLPHVGGLLVRQARIDNPPTVVVFQQVQIDEGQGTAHGHG